MTLSKSFLHQSVDFLEGHYLPKIEQCLKTAKTEDLWWRPNEQSNSVGNLVLHLAGNIRQWIVSGLGGKTDTRERQREFDERSMIPGAELQATIRASIHEAAAVLRSLDPEALLSNRTIQGKEVTMMYAIYHVVEHCSMHTGQIIQITKERSGQDLQFYGFEKQKPVERWRKRDNT